MIDTATQKPIQVLLAEVSGPYLWVSVDNIDRVRRVLEAHEVSFWVSHHAIAVNGKPAVTVINIKKGTNPDTVQGFLDQAV